MLILLTKLPLSHPSLAIIASQKLSLNAAKECESEISSKSVIVSKLELKTLDISKMLERMQERSGAKQNADDAKKDQF